MNVLQLILLAAGLMAAPFIADYVRVAAARRPTESQTGDDRE